jgi:hypothetical protein
VSSENQARSPFSSETLLRTFLEDKVPPKRSDSCGKDGLEKKCKGKDRSRSSPRWRHPRPHFVAELVMSHERPKPSQSQGETGLMPRAEQISPIARCPLASTPTLPSVDRRKLEVFARLHPIVHRLSLKTEPKHQEGDAAQTYNKETQKPGRFPCLLPKKSLETSKCSFSP